MWPGRLPEPTASHPTTLKAARVPVVGGVDGMDAVVEPPGNEQQRPASAMAPEERHRLLHPIVQQTSVGQAGQRIEKGQLLAGFALGVVVLQDEVDDLVGMLSGQRLGREEQVAFHECNGAGSR
jgi:hypothetical protein